MDLRVWEGKKKGNDANRGKKIGGYPCSASLFLSIYLSILSLHIL